MPRLSPPPSERIDLARTRKTATEIVRVLGGHKLSKGWMAHCPAHEDRTPSLSIDETRDGKILVHCHAGCTQNSVIDALKDSGLWSASEEHRPIAPVMAKPKPVLTVAQERTLTATYDYVDERGALLFQVLRYQPKNF